MRQGGPGAVRKVSRMQDTAEAEHGTSGMASKKAVETI
jgi:hypothetical protein